MPVRTSYDHGTPSWLDLSTPDPAGAKAFYASLFGWDWEDNPTDQDGGMYHMASIGGKATAGMMLQPPEQAGMGIPPMWNSYVTVDNIDTTLAQVTEAGGSVMMPSMDVMGAGQMAVVVDPTGAVLCLWQAGESIGAELVNEHGSLVWTEVQTPDVPAAAAFYAKVFGWGTEEMDMGPMGTYTIFKVGEEGVCGAMNPPAEGIPAHWSTVFAVNDCDATVAAAKAAGGSVMSEPLDMPVGRGAVLADPSGAVFQVLAVAPQPE